MKNLHETGQTGLLGIVLSSDELGLCWWDCATHGRAQANAWGCPECVREMRGEIAQLRAVLEVAVRQNEHDMLMTGEELRGCRKALEWGA